MTPSISLSVSNIERKSVTHSYSTKQIDELMANKDITLSLLDQFIDFFSFQCNTKKVAAETLLNELRAASGENSDGFLTNAQKLSHFNALRSHAKPCHLDKFNIKITNSADNETWQASFLIGHQEICETGIQPAHDETGFLTADDDTGPTLLHAKFAALSALYGMEGFASRYSRWVVGMDRMPIANAPYYREDKSAFRERLEASIAATIEPHERDGRKILTECFQLMNEISDSLQTDLNRDIGKVGRANRDMCVGAIADIEIKIAKFQKSAGDALSAKVMLEKGCRNSLENLFDDGIHFFGVTMFDLKNMAKDCSLPFMVEKIFVDSSTETAALVTQATGEIPLSGSTFSTQAKARAAARKAVFGVSGWTHSLARA